MYGTAKDQESRVLPSYRKSHLVPTGWGTSELVQASSALLAQEMRESSDCNYAGL